MEPRSEYADWLNAEPEGVGRSYAFPCAINRKGIMYLGQRVTFRSGGIKREGFVTRVVETAKGAMLGSIVAEPGGGSFFVRAHKGNPRNAVNYGLTAFQIDRDMRNNRAAGF